MIGGSKIAGHAQHNSAKYFCDLCLLLKGEINCVHAEALPPRTKETEYRSACAWRDATSAAERDRIFKEFGIRWSVLYYLEYWDPTRMLASDPMHNLFLGLVHYHCRVVMGIDWNKPIKKMPGTQTTYKSFENPNVDVLDRGRAKLTLATSAEVISKLNKNVLWMLCAESGIDLELQENPTCKILADLLWVSTCFALIISCMALTFFRLTSLQRGSKCTNQLAEFRVVLLSVTNMWTPAWKKQRESEQSLSGMQ